MKLGLWLPHRKVLRPVSAEKPGIFLTPIAQTISSALRRKFKVLDGLDFRKASVVGRKIALGATDLAELDAFLWFSHLDKSSDGHHMLVLEALGRSGVEVLNPPAGLRIGLDKFKTSSVLQSGGVRVPDFALVPSGDLEKAGDLLDKWGEVLVKPRYGSFGVGIVRVGDRQQLVDMLDFMDAGEYYIERFYENDMNKWCGINVVGGKVLHGYGKKASKIAGWKVHDRGRKGGEMILRAPTETQRQTAEKVAKITNLAFFGVDIICADDGKEYVVDLNTFPGIYPDMLKKAKIDIGSEFARMVSERLA